MKRTPIARGRGARTKGGRGENEIKDLLQEIGFDAKRTRGSGIDGNGDLSGVPDHYIEVRRRERICFWEWTTEVMSKARPTDVPTLVVRRNLSPWFVVVPAEDYFGLVKELQELRGQ